MPPLLLNVATCSLDQWALEFDANLARTSASIAEAKRLGCTYRVGPELELSGYGCEDHFCESDTLTHCAESLAQILASDLTDGILCDIGLPVLHDGVRYNCRALCLDRKLVLLRPKMCMADDGNYRETRYFTAWPASAPLATHTLSAEVAAATGQATCPFGVALLRARDAVFACEVCEELFVPDSPHVRFALAGADVIGNGSGSHHQLRKMDERIELIAGATRRCGGAYLYANQRGCDGGRMYFDGGSLVAVNGEPVARASQFSLRDVEVVAATVDLEAVRSYRASISSAGGQAAAAAAAVPSVSLGDFRACVREPPLSLAASPPLPAARFKHSPEEECALGPACWLWDYLRRSGAGGFFVPLSGGSDSAAVVAIVGVMCELACAAAAAGDATVARDVRRLAGRPAGDGDAPPVAPRELAEAVLHTAYLGTVNSSAATRRRAQALATQVGAYHKALLIDAAVAAVLGILKTVTGTLEPRFESAGGSAGEDLALQNLQARLRMVVSYLLAQLLPWARGRRGFLLVLGTANVDEALRGYMTKYDCSAADLNPIGAMSKIDLRAMLKWAAASYGYDVLLEIADAPPTAELRPHDEQGGEHTQTDEEDMGMTYAELSVFGRLRKVARCGPVSMFRRLAATWSHLPPAQVADKVKRFFKFYAINRHKATVLPPSYHAESYSPDDNRYDLRPFLYNVGWPRQFGVIDRLVRGAGGAGEAA